VHWRFKYLLQKGFSLLPAGLAQAANGFASRRFGGLRDPQFYGFSSTLAMCSLLARYGVNPKGASFVEIGTGWDASSALVLLSLGARSVHSYDLNRHLDRRLLDSARLKFIDVATHATATVPFPCDAAEVAARCNEGAIDLKRFLYHAPHDARRTGLETASVDCYFSQAVLEHVGVSVVAELLRESYRVLKPGGVCYHYIQPAMHASWADPKSTTIDYLACSDWVWRTLFQNDVSHENRLRGVEYLGLVRDAGFEIAGSWHTVDQKALAALPAKRVARRFRGFTAEELATDYVWILGRKPNAGGA
jgi:SAM-dependent methyltransferase